MIRRKTVLLLSAFAAFVLSCCPRGGNSGFYEADALCFNASARDWVMGTGRLYPETVPAPPAAPKGYVPVYLSHYGRHGSRYMDGKNGYGLVSEVLRRAAADGRLTPLGKDIWAKYSSALPYLSGRIGELTPLGALQQRQIARRMVDNYPRLFRKGARVVANSTNLERTMLSMCNFNQALLQSHPWLDIHADAGRLMMGHINQHSPENPKVTPEDVQWKSADAPWRPEFDRYCGRLLHWEAFCSMLFDDMEYVRSICDPVRFERDYFAVAKNLPSCPVEDCGLFWAVPEEEQELLGRLENYTFYVEKSLWPGGNGRGCYLSEAVLGDIMAHVAEDLRDGVNVRLRFGHDGCIMALFALMGLYGWSDVPEDPERAWEYWDVSRIPMACNFQLVFFAPRRSAAKPVEEELLVMMMLNEEPVALPLKELPASGRHEYVAPGAASVRRNGSGPYYRWSDFVEHYTPILDNARMHLAQ